MKSTEVSLKDKLRMKEYPAHLLCYGKGADSTFSSVPAPQPPGTAYSSQDQLSGDIILAGGFPSIHPDTPFPLSPTLQLNGDLANFSETEMTLIGRAELTRSNSQSFRSYMSESNPRVAVLGANANSLHAFLSRYSGVLQIDALLLQGCEPELTTAEDLKIVSRKDGCQLSYMVRKPIDLEKCSYCGACGPVCPERCLSEQLFLDFTRCTFCKECVTACSLDAIDLHGREKRELLVPAVLLLEGANVNLPRQTHRIYLEKDLDSLFDSIYTAQVEEVITLKRNICQYSGKLNTGCDACMAACRYGAVLRDQNGIHIDHLQCTECGSCLAACPTGALQYARFDDNNFVEYFRTVAIPADSTVVLGNEQDLHRFWWSTARSPFNNIFFLEYPQPHALSAMHMFMLYAMGAARIIVLAENKEECASLRLQIKLVNEVIDALFNINNPVRFSKPDNLRFDLTQAVDPSPLSKLYHDFSFTNRRAKLAELLLFLNLQSDTEPVPLTSIAAGSFGTIICDEAKCTLCSACVGECRIEALIADSNAFSLNHHPALCVQCGICIDVCPERALSLQPGLPLHADFFQEKQLAQAEPA